MRTPSKGLTVLDLVGATPVVRLSRVVRGQSADVWAKLEFYNPAGSVKDRIAVAMVEAAETAGSLRPGMTIVEPTSGNTGIGLAMVAAVKGYRMVITMPEGVSEERQKILTAYGAEVVLTPPEKGIRGAIEEAVALEKGRDDVFLPQQFENPANPEIHRRTTAREIVAQMDGPPDAFVAGVGTGGTLTGVGQSLKDLRADVLVVGVEPADSPVLSGGEPGPTEIDGLGAGMIPDVLDTEVFDRVVVVTNSDARSMARRLAREEGIFAGFSSGAAVHATVEIAAELGRDRQVVVILPDSGERYLGTFLFH
ncbi:MAG: cysteine synthase A [Candidatus Latescibacteria bacterium]|jgi:cysteine synthase A|nr:cysteine synthase A [Candidatus Latescibacterota bacterium]